MLIGGPGADILDGGLGNNTVSPMNGIDTEGSGRRDGTASTIDLTAVAGSVEISGLAAAGSDLAPESSQRFAYRQRSV